MSRSQQGARSGQRDSQGPDGKLPEIACLQECKRVTSQPLKEQKLPILTSDHTHLDTKVSGKSFDSCLFENSWNRALIKKKRIKQAEYAPASDLRDPGENVAMPSLPQGSERYSAILSSPPIAQKIQGAANSFPNSSCINDDPSLPPLYLLPPTSSQYFLESYYKNRGERAMGDTNKRGACSWKPGPLKTSGMHGGGRELGAVRLKKYNRCSSLISFPDVSKFKSGYCFRDPVRGAPPRYLQRLSELAALECETIHQEKSRKIRKTKKEEL